MWLTPIEALRHWGAYFSDQTALEIGPRVVTYGELISRSIATSHILRTPESGQLFRCVVVAERKLDFLVAAFAAMLAGKSVVCINPTLSQDQLQVILKRSGSSIALGGRESNSKVRLACERLEIPCHFVVDTNTSFQKLTTAEIFGDDLPVERRGLDAEWGLFFSSGSTGDAKPIVQSHLGVISESLAWCLGLELTKRDRFLVARPLFYTGGLALTLACLTVGATVLLFDGAENDVRDTLHAVESHAARGQIDWLFLVPEQVRGIIALKRRWARNGNPKSLLVMGSKISAKTKVMARDFFGAAVLESWGNSEGLGTLTSAEDLDTRPDSIGKPFIGERVLVVDDDAKPVPCGSVGRLAGSAETMFSEYANLPKETKETRRDGLVISGDLGRIDEEGYLYILGRKEDVIFLPSGDVLAISVVEEQLRNEFDGFDGIVLVRATANSPDFGILVAGGLLTNGAEELVESVRAYAVGILPTGSHVAVILVSEIPRLASGKTDRLAALAVLGWKD